MPSDCPKQLANLKSYLQLHNFYMLYILTLMSRTYVFPCSVLLLAFPTPFWGSRISNQGYTPVTTCSSDVVWVFLAIFWKKYTKYIIEGNRSQIGDSCFWFWVHRKVLPIRFFHSWDMGTVSTPCHVWGQASIFTAYDNLYILCVRNDVLMDLAA